MRSLYAGIKYVMLCGSGGWSAIRQTGLRHVTRISPYN